MDIEAVICQVGTWWMGVTERLPTGPLYVFGSSIVKGGAHFDPSSSDLDLVTIFPPDLPTAVERTAWLDELLKEKIELERELLHLLKRTDASQPIVSFVPITAIELAADVHKSRVANFFKINEVRLISDAATSSPQRGIPSAGDRPISNAMVRQVLEHCQGVRNKFFEVSAIASKFPLAWASETEAMPKALLRIAAQAASAGLPEEADDRFDLNVGHGELVAYLFARRGHEPIYREAYDWLMGRSGGRGSAKNLEPRLHLFFSEVLYDLASATIAGSANPRSTLAERKEELATAPSMAASMQSTSAVPTTLRIGPAGLLIGDREELTACIAEATYNLRWRLKPYFQLQLTELDEVQKTLVETEGAKDADARIARVAALDQMTRLEALRSELELGLQFLIFYQRIFFKDKESLFDDLIGAMSAYSLFCLDPSARGTHFGGPLEAWPDVVLEDMPFDKIQFGLPEPVLAALLGAAPGRSSEELLSLAANNKPLSSVPQSALAVHFIPLYVHALIESGRLKGDVIESSSEELEVLSEARFWRLGVH